MKLPFWLPRRNRGGLIYVLILIMLALHNDFWLWDRIHPLVLGWMPIGLFYHVAYMIVAVVVLALMVRFAWPEPPDEIIKGVAEKGRPDGESSRRKWKSS